jgi:hypothetical protein
MYCNGALVAARRTQGEKHEENRIACFVHDAVRRRGLQLGHGGRDLQCKAWQVS